MPANCHPQERILVMRYRFIGDTVLLVPFLRNLRRAKPNAIIDVLVGPNSGEILTHCPYINSLIVLDTTRKHRYEQKTGESPKGFWHYVGLLRQSRYTTAYVLKRSWSSALLALLAGIPNRVGFNTEGRGMLLTKRVPYRKDAHELDCFLDVLQADGIPTTDRHLEAWWGTEDDAAVGRLWQTVIGKRHCLIHVTASNAEKEWPTAFWQSLVPWLVDAGYTLHAVGAPGDKTAYEAVLGQLTDSQREKFHVWCGQTSLTESMALIARMNLAVGVDSGTMHMAAAAGVPVVVLMPASNVTKWQPLGDNGCVVTQQDFEIVKAQCQTLFQHSPTVV